MDTQLGFADHAGTGPFWINLQNGGIEPGSRVTASICELDANGNPKTGDAIMSIQNVVPLNGQVAFHVAIMRDAVNPWPGNLPFRVSFAFVT
ncbi:hypothetical protein ACGFRB_06740 [Streptomyces sp. NPDC048718]|uniref:hypothetical protein n=1 Tax=Streptomyces sp. NPDC048718 TaxID=3365587 RepID=UPI003710FF86